MKKNMTDSHQLSFDFIDDLTSNRESKVASNMDVDSSKSILGSNVRKIDEEQDSVITRPIHYLGSKLRLLDEICQAINDADPSMGTVIDLFAGSGTVSRAFAQDRKVIAIDIQEYSRVLSSAILNPVVLSTEESQKIIHDSISYLNASGLWDAFLPLMNVESEVRKKALEGELEPLCDFLENCSFLGYKLGECESNNPKLIKALSSVRKSIGKSSRLSPAQTMVTRHFGGLYFSFEQAVGVDAILEIISKSNTKMKDVLLACLLSSVSDIVNTIGKQFAQPLRPRTSKGKPKDGLITKVEKDRSLDIFATYTKWINKYLELPAQKKHHEVVRIDYLKGIQKYGAKSSVIYADPPYTRDHYSRFYHVLETICLRDDPDITTIKTGGRTKITRGLYRINRHQSDFCIKSKAPEAFRNLFQGVSDAGVPLVLSYSPYDTQSGGRSRLLTIDQVIKIADAYFRKIALDYPKTLSHSKLNATERNYESLEYGEALLICSD